jgi:glycosyltransferase 2 family protein
MEVIKETLKKKNKKYTINIAIIIFVAFSFTAYTLFTDDNLGLVLNAFSEANLWIIAIIFLMMTIVILVESTILFILARLYTTRYTLRKGIGNYFIGSFFSHITPSSSGGQFAQAYTFKQQGIELANAASILVMHFLLYQIAQVFFGALALIFRFETFSSSALPITIGTFSFSIIDISLVGFAINFLIIFGILILAKSKFIHSVVISSMVSFLGFLKIIKKPKTVNENLKIQIENFGIELRRLQSNTAVTVVLLVLFFLRMTLTNALPYFSAMAIPSIDLSNTNIFDSIFMTAYLNVIVNFAPLPGAVGFSEFFFSYLFQGLFGGYSQTIAPQLIWRGVTFYFTLIIGSLVVLFYRFGKRHDVLMEDTTSFVELQKQTIEIRRQTSEMMFHTSEMKTVNIRHKFSKVAKDFFGFKRRKVDKYGRVLDTAEIKRKEKHKK